jgi:hypothetical protein
MTVTHQLTQIDAQSVGARSLRIAVAGSGLFVVMQGNRELLRGTFEQCYHYVSAALRGPAGG